VSDQAIDVEAVLADLKDFQRRTARWAFKRMFADADAAVRFLVADEVGLGKTHVAKGVIAQAIDHLGRTGDKRHDIVYICSNAAIARQNIRKLVPAGIEPVTSADRLTMLPLAELDEGDESRAGVNVVAITPGTSLNFGRSTGRREERFVAYTFLRAHWGRGVMNRPARRIFWHGLWAGNPDKRLRSAEREYRPLIGKNLGEFVRRLNELDESRVAQGKPTLRALFDQLASGLAHQRRFPNHLLAPRNELIAELRRVMALVGLDAIRPDLVVLDEFQRFKHLLQSEPETLAVELAQQLFSYCDPETGRATRTLLLSATPYRMYTIYDEVEDDHYRDFLDTCSFLFQDPERLQRLQDRLRVLRHTLTSTVPLSKADEACRSVEAELRSVMARTERLAATPDRDGMLCEPSTAVKVMRHDLHAYMRFSSLAEAVGHYEPTEYWKSGPYLVNFMEGYRFKEAIMRAAEDGQFAQAGELDPGPGLLSWDDVEEYRRIDPQNGRLRWLLDDLECSHAFELLWIPPSMRYYDTESVYEAPEAAQFTKRLIFSGWTVVPKVVSSLVSFEAERRAFAARSHNYTADYRRRGGQRLAFRTTERAEQARPGEATGARRAAAMTVFLLIWPSPSLARLGDPRPQTPRQRSQVPGIDGAEPPAAGDRIQISELLDSVAARLADAVEPLVGPAPTDGVIDQRWYWAAPLFLDQQRAPSVIDLLLGPNGAWYWEGDDAGQGLRAHIAEARAMIEHGPGALGRPPGDLVEVLAELAVGGPAQCALRMISSVCGLPASHDDGTAEYAAWIGAAFRSFFNSPEVTAVVTSGHSEHSDADEGDSRYWRDVVRHSIDGNLQAVLDEHGHVLRDWLGHLSLGDDERRWNAAYCVAEKLAEALELRTSSYRVDVPVRAGDGGDTALDSHRMRTRFAVAFAHQTLDEGGEARIGSVSAAFNSPFWPFVLTSTSIGQEGLDFHLWCHAVVHWNLPSNPVDLEQREGRVHRYKGHAVRRNIASTLGPEMGANGQDSSGDTWDRLFTMASARRTANDDEMVPYWVFHGQAKIERLVPVLPFSREEAALPRLRKTLAAYRLALGQPRQEELVEFLGENFSDEELGRLRIDLSPCE
jgi:hypothetical protein